MTKKFYDIKDCMHGLANAKTCEVVGEDDIKWACHRDAGLNFIYATFLRKDTYTDNLQVALDAWIRQLLKLLQTSNTGQFEDVLNTLLYYANQYNKLPRYEGIAKALGMKYVHSDLATMTGTFVKDIISLRIKVHGVQEITYKIGRTKVQPSLEFMAKLQAAVARSGHSTGYVWKVNGQHQELHD